MPGEGENLARFFKGRLALPICTRKRVNTTMRPLERLEEERGVSPVIAVVMMIGVTVVLGAAALAGGAQFFDGFGENPSAQITFDVNSDDELEVLANTVDGDVNDLKVTVDGDDADWVDDDSLNASTGSVATIESGTGAGQVGDGERVIVTAHTDNNDGTVADFTYPESS